MTIERNVIVNVYVLHFLCESGEKSLLWQWRDIIACMCVCVYFDQQMKDFLKTKKLGVSLLREEKRPQVTEELKEIQESKQWIYSKML